MSTMIPMMMIIVIVVTVANATIAIVQPSHHQGRAGWDNITAIVVRDRTPTVAMTTREAAQPSGFVVPRGRWE